MMTNHGVCQDITGGGGWSPVLLLLQSSERAGHAISMTSEEDKYMCGRAAGYLGLCVCVSVYVGGGLVLKTKAPVFNLPRGKRIIISFHTPLDSKPAKISL